MVTPKIASKTGTQNWRLHTIPNHACQLAAMHGGDVHRGDAYLLSITKLVTTVSLLCVHTTASNANRSRASSTIHNPAPRSSLGTAADQLPVPCRTYGNSWAFEHLPSPGLRSQGHAKGVRQPCASTQPCHTSSRYQRGAHHGKSPPYPARFILRPPPLCLRPLPTLAACQSAEPKGCVIASTC